MAADGDKPRGWLARLKAGLARSSSKISDGVGAIFAKRKLDAESVEALEELLIAADLGVETAAELAGAIAAMRFEREVEPEAVRAALADRIAEILAPVAKPLELDPARRPTVILVVGVNGTGKTTTIGKLAKRFREEGLSVMLAAGDTFRAAAIEQLEIWGRRVDAPVVTTKPGGDPAGVAFEAVDRARAAGTDVLLIDTAGRLHNRDELMAELAKIVRVIRKKDPSAPHDTILVLDATTGQNALNQAQVFRDVAEISGIVMTKLDGTAKGGVLVALAERFGLPIHAIGVGEDADDLQPFDADAFARALVGLEAAETA
ncbi:MAG: signal recognition particle-docking protein FtsY [Alphaproteobacteria bacterium]|nr:MAG: signal recognition particle-docking protein FtsY [Alphaproteobacteria bacterium]